MHRKALLLARGLALAALALSLGGCGKPQFDVTGKVTYNGAPLAKPNGQIVFVGPDGTQVAAPIAQDGTYTATKVTGGLNKIAIYYLNPNFSKASRPKGPPDPKNRPKVSPQYLTPEALASVTTSGLSKEVTQGTVCDVELTGPPIP